MAPALANPLRRPRPTRSQHILRRRIYFTDGRGRVMSQIGSDLILARDVVWLSSELAIPISAITAVGIVERRGLPRRRFLELTYVNPITGRPEVLHLAVLHFLGFYRREPLVQLVTEVERLRQMPAGPSTLPEPRAAQATDRCEVCGDRPAYYVPYVYQVAALFFSWRSGARRRIHCRRHNLQHGLAYYAATALLGWPVVNPVVLFSYPVATYAAGLNLRPSLGKAAYVLGVLPGIVTASVVAWWIVSAFS